MEKLTGNREAIYTVSNGLNGFPAPNCCWHAHFDTVFKNALISF